MTATDVAVVLAWVALMFVVALVVTRDRDPSIPRAPDSDLEGLLRPSDRIGAPEDLEPDGGA